jgi:hypothetical protein
MIQETFPFEPDTFVLQPSQPTDTDGASSHISEDVGSKDDLTTLPLSCCLRENLFPQEPDT